MAYQGPPLPRSLRTLLSQKPTPAKALETTLWRQPLHPSWASRLSKTDTRRLRNAIFALQGARFRSVDLQNFFAKQPWYRPIRSTQAIMLSPIARENLSKLLSAEQRTPRMRPQDPPLQITWEPSPSISPIERELCTRSLLHQARTWRYHHLAYFAFLKLRVLTYRRYLWAVIELSSQMYYPLPPSSPRAPLPPFKSSPVAGGKALLLGRSCTRWKVISYGNGPLSKGFPQDLRERLRLP